MDAERQENTELALLRLVGALYFLVGEVRGYVAERRRRGERGDHLAALEQSAGLAEAKVREYEPWRGEHTAIALLRERVAMQREWIRQAGHREHCALQYGGACSCGWSDLTRSVREEL